MLKSCCKKLTTALVPATALCPGNSYDHCDMQASTRRHPGQQPPAASGTARHSVFFTWQTLATNCTIIFDWSWSVSLEWEMCRVWNVWSYHLFAEIVFCVHIFSENGMRQVRIIISSCGSYRKPPCSDCGYFESGVIRRNQNKNDQNI